MLPNRNNIQFANLCRARAGMADNTVPGSASVRPCGRYRQFRT